MAQSANDTITKVPSVENSGTEMIFCDAVVDESVVLDVVGGGSFAAELNEEVVASAEEVVVLVGARAFEIGMVVECAKVAVSVELPVEAEDKDD